MTQKLLLYATVFLVVDDEKYQTASQAPAREMVMTWKSLKVLFIISLGILAACVLISDILARKDVTSASLSVSMAGTPTVMVPNNFNAPTTCPDPPQNTPCHYTEDYGDGDGVAFQEDATETDAPNDYPKPK